MKRLAKPVAWTVALAFAIGTGTVATLVLNDEPAEAAVSPAPPPFECNSLYAVRSGAAGYRAVSRFANLPTMTATVPYTASGMTPTNSVNTMAVGPEIETDANGQPLLDQDGKPVLGQLVAYHWDWNDVRVHKVTPGSTDTPMFSVPGNLDTSASAGWSGGEVIQHTGQIFMSSSEFTDLRNDGRGDFNLMIHNPVTHETRASRTIAPDTGEAVTALTGDIDVASDMAVDAEGNAYVVVGSGTTKWVLRITPGQHNTTWYWKRVVQVRNAVSGSTFYGMAFLNGFLYLAMSTTLYKIDTMSGAMSTVGSLGSQPVFDLAACQTAPVIRGKVYNDVNGDGEPNDDNPNTPADEGALQGATVEIYDANGAIRGVRTTGPDGGYDFIVNDAGPNAEFYIRVKQPQVNGANALQTWASASAPTSPTDNEVTPLCATGPTTYYDPISQSGVCLGARPDSIDPSTAPHTVAANGTVSGGFSATKSSGTWPVNSLLGTGGGAAIVSKVNVRTSTEVAYADFAVTGAASYGDAPYKTLLASDGPYHAQDSLSDANSLWGSQLYLGNSRAANSPVEGPVSGTDTTDPHASTDDGVEIQLTDGGAWTSLREAVLAINKTYNIRAKVSGSLASTATVQGWGGDLKNAVSPTAANVFTPEITMGAVTNGYSTGQLFTGSGAPQGAPPTWVRFRVSPYSGMSATSGTKPPAANSTAANTNAWSTPGEVEDYRVFVASGTLALQARSLGGEDTFGFTLGNISTTHPSSATDSITTLPNNAWASSGTGHVFQTVNSPVTFTPSNIPTGYNVTGVACEDANGQSFTPTVSGTTYTIPAGQVTTGAALSCGVSFAKEIDVTESSLVVQPAGSLPVTDAGGYTATVTAKTAGGSPLEGVNVRFTVAPSASVTITPPLTNGQNCTTGPNGQCSVNIKATTAGTYTITAEGQNLGTSNWVTIGSEQREYTVDINACSVKSLETTPTGSQVVGNAFTGKITLEDSMGNGCSVPLNTLSRSATEADVTLGQITAVNAAAGEYSFSINATLSGTKHITATYTPPSGAPSSQSAQVVYTPDNENASASLSVSPNPLKVNATTNGTVVITDPGGSRVDGTVQFHLVGIQTSSPVADQHSATLTTVNGTASAPFTTSVSGTYRLTATVTVDGSPVTTFPSQMTVTFQADDPSPLTSTLEAGTSSVLMPDGVDTHTAIATVRDADGNPVPGAPVTFALKANGIGTITNAGATQISGNTDGTWSCTTGSDPSNAATYGKCTMSIISNHVVGNAIVRAKFGNPQGAANQDIQVSPTNPAPAELSMRFQDTDLQSGTFEVRSSGTKVANGSEEHEIWVRLTSRSGAPLISSANLIDMTVDDQDLGMTGISITESQTTQGLYVVKVKSLNSGVFPAGGTAGGITLTQVGTANTIEFVSDIATTAEVYVASAGTDVLADDNETHTVELVVKDTNGNGVLLANPATAISATATHSVNSAQLATWVQALVPVDPTAQPFAGLYRGTIKTGVAGTYIVAATVNGSVNAGTPVNRSNQAVFKQGTPCSTTTTLGIDPAELWVGGTAQATAEVKDCTGNQIDGQRVRFRTAPALTLPANGEMTTGNGGKAVIDISTTTAGTYTVYADVLESNGTVLFTTTPVTVEFKSNPVRGEIELVSVTPPSPTAAVGVENYVVKVRVVDSVGTGNPITAGTVSVATSPVGDSTVTLSNPAAVGSSEPGVWSFTVGSTSVDPKTIRATYTYQTRTDFVDVPVKFSNRPLSETHSTLTFNDDEVVVAQPITATVTVKDSNDQAVPGAAIVLSVRDASTGQPLVREDGTTQAVGITGTSQSTGTWTYTFSTHRAGTYEVTAIVTDPNNATNQVTLTGDVTFTNTTCDPTSARLLSATGGSAKRPGQEHHEATVQLYDEYDNPCLGFGNIPITFEVSGVGSLAPGHAAIGNADPATGRRTVNIVSANAREGDALVKARTGAAATYVPDETVPTQAAELALPFANVDPPDTQFSEFSVSTGQRSANGTDSHTVTVVLATRTGAGTSVPMSGQQSLLSALAVGENGQGDASVGAFTETATPGTYQASITSSAFGWKTVSVAWNRGSINQTNITANGTDRVFFDGDVAHPVIELEADTTITKVANSTDYYLVTATVKDSNGLPITRGTVTATEQGGTGLIIGTVTPANQTTDPGVYTIQVRSSETLTHTLLGTYTGPSSGQTATDTIALTFDPDIPTTQNSRLTLSTNSLQVNSSVTATVAVQDQFTHVIPGANVTFTVVDSDGNPIVVGSPVTWTGTTGSGGTYAVTFTTAKADTYTVSASVTKDGVTITPTGSPATVVFNPGPPSPVTTTLTSDTLGQTKTPNGSEAHHATVTVRDADGNLIDGVTVVMSVQGGVGAGFGIAPALTGTTGSGSNAKGEFTIAITSQDVATAAVTAIAAGSQVLNSQGQTARLELGFDSGGPCADPNLTYYTVVGQSPQTVGTGSYTLRAHLETCANEPVRNKEANLTATAIGRGIEGNAVVSAFQEDMNNRGEYTATITSQKAGLKDLALLWRDPPGVGQGQAVPPQSGTNPWVEFVSNGQPAIMYYSVSNLPNVPANAQNPQFAYVYMEDQYQNPIKDAAAKLSGQATDGYATVGPFRYDNTNGEGNYVANITSGNAGDHPIAVRFTAVQGGNPVTLQAGPTGQENVIARFVADAAACATISVTGASPQTVGTGQYTAQVRVTDGSYDAATQTCGGNPKDGATVVLQARDQSQTSATLIPSDGVMTTSNGGIASYTIKSDLAGIFNVSATFGVESASNTRQVEFVAGPPSRTSSRIYKGDDQPRRSDGLQSHEVTIELFDSLGNVVKNRQVQFVLDANSPAFAQTQNPPATLQPGANATATTDDSGKATIFVRSGTPVVNTPIYGNFRNDTGTGWVGIQTSDGSQPAKVDLTFEAGTVNTVNSSVEVATRAQEVVANASSTHTARVTLVDDDGNPAVVNITAIGGSATMGQTVIPITGWAKEFPSDPNSATYIATFSASTAGTYVVTSTYLGEAISVLRDQNGDLANRARFISGPPVLTNMSYTVTNLPGVKANSSDEQTVTIKVADAQGNATDLNALTDVRASGGATVVSGFQSTGTRGEYQATITSAVAGTFQIQAQFSGSGAYQDISLATGGNATTTFVPSGASPAKTTLEVVPNSQTVGQNVTARVTVRDGFGPSGQGNPVQGQRVRISIDPPTVPPIAPALLTGQSGPNGVVEFTFTTQKVQTHTVTAYLVDEGGNETALTQGPRQVSFVSDTASLATLERVSEESAFIGATATPHKVKVTVTDQFGNPKGAIPITWTPTSGLQGATYTPALTGQVTQSNGEATLDIRASTPMNGYMGVAVASGAIWPTPQQVRLVFENSPVVPGASEWWLETYGDTKVADNSASSAGSYHVLRVKLVGSNGSAVIDQALAQNIAINATAPGAVAKAAQGFTLIDPTQGIYEVRLITNVAGLRTLSVDLGGAIPPRASNQTTAEWVAGPPSPVYSTFTVDATPAIANGNDTVPVTVDLRDANNNPVKDDASNTVASRLTPSAAGATASTFGTGQDGVYDATVKATVRGDYPVEVYYQPATGASFSVPVAGNGTAHFVPGPPSTRSDLTLTTHGIQKAVTTENHIAKVVVMDSSGNRVPGATVVFSIPNTRSQTNQPYTQTADGQGEATLAFTADAVGTYPVTATVTKDGSTPVAATPTPNPLVAAFVNAPVAGNSWFEVDQVGDVVADGADGHYRTIIAHLESAAHVPIAGRAGDLQIGWAPQAGPRMVDMNPAQPGLQAFAPSTSLGAGYYEARMVSTVADDFTVTVTIDSNQLPVTTSGRNIARFVPGVGDPSRSTLSVSATQVEVGESITATVEVIDANGNRPVGQWVRFWTDAKDPMRYSNPNADYLQVQTVAGGVASVRLSTEKPGTYTVYAALTWLGDNDLQPVVNSGNIDIEFLVGPPSTVHTMLTGTSGEKHSDDSTYHEAIVTVNNKYGSPVPGQLVSFTLENPQGVTGQPIGRLISTVPSDARTGSDGKVTVRYVGDYRLGTTVVKASVGAMAVTNGHATDPASLRWDWVTGSVGTDSWYELTNNEVEANGTDTHTVTIKLYDENNDGVVDQESLLWLTATPKANAPAQPAGTTYTLPEHPTPVLNSPGVYTATMSSTYAAIFDIAVSHQVAGPIQPDPQVSPRRTTLEFVPGDPTPGNSYYEVTSGDVVVGGYHELTAVVRDGNNNGVPGLTLRAQDSEMPHIVGVDTFTSPEAGVYVAKLGSSTSGSYTMSATYTEPGSSTAVPISNGLRNNIAKFIAGTPDPDNSTLSVRPLPAQGDGTRVIVGRGQWELKVTVHDGDGNPVAAGEQVTFRVPGLVPSVTVTTGSGGIAIYTLESDTAGPFSVSAFINNTAEVDDSPQTVVFDPAEADPGNSTLVGTQGTRIADGAAFHTVTAEVLDGFGNKVPDQQITFEIVGTRGTIASTTPSNGRTDADGKVVITVVSNQDPGTANVRARLGGATGQYIIDSPGVPTVVPLLFIPGDISGEASRYEVSSGDRTVGTQTHQVTAYIRDRSGAPVELANPNQDISATALPDATVGLWRPHPDQNQRAVYVADISSNVEGLKTVAVSVAGIGLCGSSCLTEPEGSLKVRFVPDDVQTVDFRVSEYANVTANGSDYQIVEVWAKDRHGNDISGVAGDIRVQVANSTVEQPLRWVSTATDPNVRETGHYEGRITSRDAGRHLASVTHLNLPVTTTNNRYAAFVPGDALPSHSELSVSSGSKRVGDETHTATVHVQDADDNDVTGQPVLFWTDPATTPVSMEQVVTSDGGYASVEFTTQTPGTYTVYAALGSNRSGGQVQRSGLETVTFIHTDISLPHTKLGGTSGDIKLVNSTADPHQVWVDVKDRFNNPVTASGTQVTFQVAGQNGAIGGTFGTLGQTAVAMVTVPVATADNPATGAIAGRAVANLSSSGVGTFRVTARVGQTAVSDPSFLDMRFDTSDVNPSESTWSVTSGTRVAGTSAAHTLTVQLRDDLQAGIPNAGDSISVVLTPASGAAGHPATRAPFVEVDPIGSPGLYTAEIRSLYAEVYSVEVSVGEPLTRESTSPSTVEFVAGDPVWTRSTFSVTEETRIANGSDKHFVTVVLKDGNDNGVTGKAGSLAAPTPPFTVTAFEAVDEVNQKGVYRAEITSTTAVSRVVAPRYAGFLDSQPITADGNATAAFVAGRADPGESTLTVPTSGTTMRVMAQKHRAEVEAFDADGNPVIGAWVTFSTSPAITDPAWDGRVQTGTDGKASVEFTARTPGTYNVSAEIQNLRQGDGITIPTSAGSTIVEFNTGPVDEDHSYFTVSQEGQMKANGSDEQTLTVFMADSEGVGISGLGGPGSIITPHIAPNGPTFGFFVPDANVPGLYTSAITSLRSGQFTVSVTVNQNGEKTIPVMVPNGNDRTMFIPDYANPVTSVLTASPLTQTVEQTVTATVAVDDGHGNPVPSQTVRFWVTDEQGNRIVLTGAGDYQLEPKSVTNGEATITFTTSIAGKYLVHAGLVGVPGLPELAPVSGSGDVEVEFTAIRTPDLQLSRLTGTDGSSKLVGGDPATGVHTATVTVFDTSAAHNPIPNLPIVFTIDPSGVGTVRAPSTLTTTTNDEGVATLDIVSNESGDALISAKATDESSGQPVQVSVTAYPASGGTATRLVMPFHPDDWDPGESSFQVSTGNRDATGSDPHTITVTVKDGFGNGVPDAGADIHATADPAQGVVISHPFTPVNPTSYPFDGLYSAPITSTVSGTKVVSVDLGNTAIAVLPVGLDTATFVPTDPRPDLSWFEVDATPVTADGVESVPVTVTLVDGSGNGVPGQQNTLRAIARSVGVVDATISAFRPGANAGEYIADIKAEDAVSFVVTVTYTKEGQSAAAVTNVDPGPPPVTKNNVATFVAGPENPQNSTLSVTEGERVVGETHTATVTVRDATNNPVGGVDVTFWTTPDITENGNGTISPSAVMTTVDGSGKAEVTLRTTKAGRYTVHASIVDPDTSQPAPVRFSGQVSVVFKAGDPSALQSYLAIPTEGVDPVEVANGDDRHTVTVTVQDADENPVIGVRATVKIVPPGGTLGEATEYQSDASDADGVARVRFGATTAGVYTAYGYIMVNGAPAEVSDSPKQAVFVPGQADSVTSIIEVQAPKTVEANGVDRTTAIVSLKDRNGNLTGPSGAGHNVVVIPSIGTAGPTNDNLDGTYTVTLTSVAAGLATVGFELDGVGSPSHDSVTFVATPTAPVIRFANAGTMAGSAQSGNTIRVYGPDGTQICTTLAAANGTFRCSPLSPEAQHETVISATSSVTVGGRTFTSPSSSATVDAVAPEAPTLDPSNGGTVTGGGAEPGTTVVITDPGGTELCTTVADGQGNFVCSPLRPRPGDGVPLEVVTVDESDNRSDPVIEVVDAVPPEAPGVEDTDGSVIYGEAEGGSHVVIEDGSGNVLCETEADPVTGAFSCVPNRPVNDGEEIVINATDPAGNVSRDTVVISDQSGVPAPFINPTNGEKVSGKGVPGLEITVRFPGGETVTTTVRTDGNWDLNAPSGYDPRDGDSIAASQARAFNSGGAKVSPSITIRVDRTAPAAPAPKSSDGTTVQGKGEPGATVVITDAEGRELGRTVVEGNGEWTARLTPAAAEGATVTVRQTDPAGNQSPEFKLRIGKLRIVVDVPLVRNLEVQTVHIYNLQPGEKVTATLFSDPIDLGSMVADSSGSAVYSFEIALAIPEGSHHVEATGVFSGKAASGYFNVVAPQAPVIPATATVTPTVTQTATPTITPNVVVAPKPLAKTGAEGMIPAVGSALGALLAGLFLVVAAARRRRELEEGEAPARSARR
jgi:adhesin/invasin